MDLVERTRRQLAAAKAGEGVVPRSRTPFLQEAQSGDESANFLLRVMLSHGITDVSQFSSISRQEMAAILGLTEEEGQEPDENGMIEVVLTDAERLQQKRMRRWLPDDQKYAKTKKVRKG